jgi:hypothetical protein
MKVFISGKVTGVPREKALEKFKRAEMLLMKNTFDYVNPMELVPEGATNSEAMALCLSEVCKCDALLLLSDAKFSEGSKIEEMTAKYCGKQIFNEDDLI